MKFILLFTTFLALLLSTAISIAEDAEQKAVLVTGASSGIGLRITEVLSANGYVVYAGARKDADLKRLEAMDNVESVRLDVTIQDEIDAAVKVITDKGRGLYGLVNNAGIAIIGPVIEVPVDEVKWQFDVNVYGPYRVTQAFSPLLIESKGRITTTGSISGILSGPMFGPYSMSKHAIESYTDTLAVEMKRFDVKVSVIEPGSFESKIGKSIKKRLENNKYWTENTQYKDELEAMSARVGGDRVGKDPKEVADAVLHFMSSDSPKHRYMVTPNAGQASFTIQQAMREMLQLNHDQAYTLSREQLVEMLDQGLTEL